MQDIDPVPLPYGPLQYYQTHYIVDIRSSDNDQFLARCRPITKGRFQSKHIIAVKWTGDDKFTKILQSDTSSWVHEENLAFDPIMLEIADRIALHIKKMVNSTD